MTLPVILTKCAALVAVALPKASAAVPTISVPQALPVVAEKAVQMWATFAVDPRSSANQLSSAVRVGGFTAVLPKPQPAAAPRTIAKQVGHAVLTGMGITTARLEKRASIRRL